MATGKMHAEEVQVDEALARRLLAAQFPHWATLPITQVRSAGTDNAIYRLGPDMALRFPRVHWAAAHVEKEQRWLPQLASRLPLAVPVPLAKGTPGNGYPWSWSIYRWLEGDNGTLERLADEGQTAVELAHFIVALREIDPTEGPFAGSHNSFRGVPLAMRDVLTREAIAALRDTLDADSAMAAWEAALAVPPWQGQPVWIHGDLQSGNLLAVDGRLGAVIDFGCLGVGDPAVDLIVAWNLFSAEHRARFRAALDVDDATWARGRGWALSIGVIALAYYRNTNAVLAGISRRAIDEVLAGGSSR